ncbi:transposase [Gordoniibacillus kamchatkensis]
MTQFQMPRHLCSCAGMIPGHDESRGKKSSVETCKENKKLRNALVE